MCEKNRSFFQIVIFAPGDPPELSGAEKHPDFALWRRNFTFSPSGPAKVRIRAIRPKFHLFALENRFSPSVSSFSPPQKPPKKGAFFPCVVAEFWAFWAVLDVPKSPLFALWSSEFHLFAVRTAKVWNFVRNEVFFTISWKQPDFALWRWNFTNFALWRHFRRSQVGKTRFSEVLRYPSTRLFFGSFHDFIAHIVIATRRALDAWLAICDLKKRAKRIRRIRCLKQKIAT